MSHKPTSCRICCEGTPMFEMETNTKYFALPNKHCHKEVTPRVRPDPQDTCTAGTGGGEKGVELQPNSPGLQAILEDAIQVTRLVTRTESALLRLPLSAEADALP